MSDLSKAIASSIMETAGLKDAPRSLVVLSGGMDSATALALAVHDSGAANVETITFSYGQRHESEVQAAHALTRFFHVPNYLQEVTLGQSGVLMDEGAEMPHASYSELKSSEGPSPTYVPFRNGTFLALAASRALERECELIYAGMHADDAHNWAYPDCTPEFMGAMQNAIYIGTYHKVRLVAPFTYMSKKDVVLMGEELRVPWSLTRSCYEGRQVACGKCPTCVSRLEAFKEAGVIDPIQYDFDQYRRQ